MPILARMILKLLKAKDKQYILKAARKKRHITYILQTYDN